MTIIIHSFFNKKLVSTFSLKYLRHKHFPASKLYHHHPPPNIVFNDWVTFWTQPSSLNTGNTFHFLKTGYIPWKRTFATQSLIFYVAMQYILWPFQEHRERHSRDVAFLRSCDFITEWKLEQCFKTHLGKLLSHSNIYFGFCKIKMPYLIVQRACQYTKCCGLVVLLYFAKKVTTPLVLNKINSEW